MASGLHLAQRDDHMNKPQEISLAEWEELMQLPVVREAWGLNAETPEEFADMVYGVKFDFAIGGPGYAGDLYILHGEALGEPLTFVRSDGKVVAT
jgi:hypothetical protein